jgi:MFS family permease
LLTAGPAVINLVSSIPIGHWLEGRNLFRIVSTAGFLAREGYLLIAFLPLFLADSLRIWVTIFIIMLMALPSTIFIISFNAIFAEVVPPDWRAHVIGRRGAVMALSLSVTLFACGQLLDWLPNPYNYVFVFGVGAVSAMLSCYHLSKIQPEDHPEIQKRNFLPGEVNPQSPDNRPLPVQNRRSSKPLLRKDLILGSLRLSLASARWGHRKLMVSGALIFGQYPLLIGLARGPGLVYLTSLAAGFNYSFLAGGQTNRLMERVPLDDRPARMALHNLALNFGILAGSLGGPLLGNSLGLRSALFLSAGLRLLAGILLGWWG